MRGGRGALCSEPQFAAECGPEPAQLALCILPGTLCPGQLLLQAVDTVAGPVQASPEAVSHTAGLLQLRGGAMQLSPEALFSAAALREALLHLRQLLLQPQYLWRGLGLRWRLHTKGPLQTCPGPFAPAPLWHITTVRTEDLPYSPCLAGETPEPWSGRAPQDHGKPPAASWKPGPDRAVALGCTSCGQPYLSACSGPVVAKAVSPETRAGEPQGARYPTTDFPMDNTTEK